MLAELPLPLLPHLPSLLFTHCAGNSRLLRSLRTWSVSSLGGFEPEIPLIISQSSGLVDLAQREEEAQR